jgi:hypothetical protein
MKKTFDTTSLVNELRGQSVFFPTKKQETKKQNIPSFPTASPVVEPKKKEEPRKQSKQDTTTPRYHDTVIPQHHDTLTRFSEDDLLEEVRKAVKQVGKEAATQRLTLEEKQLLADIEYSYKRQGIRTSGNEILRIATNYIIREYRKNGENSVLAKIIKQLNS